VCCFMPCIRYECPPPGFSCGAICHCHPMCTAPEDCAPGGASPFMGNAQ
jgi:hypothetical protein